MCRLGQKTLLPNVEHALANGLAIIIENMGLSYDAVLTPVVGRQILRRGRATFVKLGEKEVDYDSKFKLYLQTKLSNPHYPPEIQAETTLINFMVSSIYTHLLLRNHSYATHLQHSSTTALPLCNSSRARAPWGRGASCGGREGGMGSLWCWVGGRRVVEEKRMCVCGCGACGQEAGRYGGGSIRVVG